MDLLSGVAGPCTTLLLLFLGACFLSVCSAKGEDAPGIPDAAAAELPLLHTIEGRVTVDGSQSKDEWLSQTTVSVDGGKYHGFLKSNGEFSIHGVVQGSYLVEVVSPNYVFEPVRVDISSKSGKVRARKVNSLKASSVQHLPYPLKFKAGKQAEFFEKREAWSILNTLKNPMVSPCNQLHYNIVHMAYGKPLQSIALQYCTYGLW